MEVRFADLEQTARYKLLIGLVYPRPIALISTTNANGVHNAAPFSFFNVVADEPPMVMVSFNRRRDGTLKHTVRNIRRSRCFVVNLVDEAIANRMLVAGQDLPDAVSEFEAAGLTPAPSYPPRAKHAGQSRVPPGATTHVWTSAGNRPRRGAVRAHPGRAGGFGHRAGHRILLPNRPALWGSLLHYPATVRPAWPAPAALD